MVAKETFVSAIIGGLIVNIQVKYSCINFRLTTKEENLGWGPPLVHKS